MQFITLHVNGAPELFNVNKIRRIQRQEPSKEQSKAMITIDGSDEIEIDETFLKVSELLIKAKVYTALL